MAEFITFIIALCGVIYLLIREKNKPTPWGDVWKQRLR